MKTFIVLNHENNESILINKYLGGRYFINIRNQTEHTRIQYSITFSRSIWMRSAHYILENSVANWWLIAWLVGWLFYLRVKPLFASMHLLKAFQCWAVFFQIRRRWWSPSPRCTYLTDAREYWTAISCQTRRSPTSAGRKTDSSSTPTTFPGSSTVRTVHSTSPRYWESQTLMLKVT